jgi:hypothetical protein
MLEKLERPLPVGWEEQRETLIWRRRGQSGQSGGSSMQRGGGMNRDSNGGY